MHRSSGTVAGVASGRLARTCTRRAHAPLRRGRAPGHRRPARRMQLGRRPQSNHRRRPSRRISDADRAENHARTGRFRIAVQNSKRNTVPGRGSSRDRGSRHVQSADPARACRWWNGRRACSRLTFSMPGPRSIAISSMPSEPPAKRPQQDLAARRVLQDVGRSFVTASATRSARDSKSS